MISPTLAKVICPHRGLGKENSIKAIDTAISTSPYMVEFDIQNIKGQFYLGHPPNINYKDTLEDTLSLFEKSEVLPKIDLKCGKYYEKDIKLLLNKVNVSSGMLLINIGGDNLNSTEFMTAEKLLMIKSRRDILLNIDIARYKNKNISEMKSHIQTLPRKPHSISPMLETEYDRDVQIAYESGIRHLHFWSNSTKTYTEKELLAVYEKYIASGFKVYFDINPTIIA